MKLTPRQHSLLLYACTATLVALLLLGAFHFHEGDGGSPCWYCVVVAAALFPVQAVLVAPPRVSRSHPLEATREPAWFRWVSHHRRGPPAAI